MSNKVAKTKANGQLMPAVSLDLVQADAESISGLENANSPDDLALPFLKVLSQLSPQCNKTSNSFVEGAESGMIYNTVSGKLYDGEEGIDVVPAFIKESISSGVKEEKAVVLPLPYMMPTTTSLKRQETQTSKTDCLTVILLRRLRTILY